MFKAIRDKAHNLVHKKTGFSKFIIKERGKNLGDSSISLDDFAIKISVLMGTLRSRSKRPYQIRKIIKISSESIDINHG